MDVVSGYYAGDDVNVVCDAGLSDEFSASFGGWSDEGVFSVFGDEDEVVFDVEDAVVSFSIFFHTEIIS